MLYYTILYYSLCGHRSRQSNGWALCPAWFPKVPSRATRCRHYRPSPSPTVNVYSTPACQGRARLDGSSRRPAPTPTRTHKHARTHPHAHPHPRAQARARDRAHAHAHAPARERKRTHAHANASKRTTHTHTRKHKRPRPHPCRYQGRPT